jgi:hypothetical protein
MDKQKIKRAIEYLQSIINDLEDGRTPNSNDVYDALRALRYFEFLYSKVPDLERISELIGNASDNAVEAQEAMNRLMIDSPISISI